MSIRARFRHELVIERATPGATTPRGHTLEGFTDVSPSVWGLVQERPDRSRGGAEVDAPDHDQLVLPLADVWLPFGTEITNRDRLRVVATGVRYEVVGPIVDAGGRGRHLEAECQRVPS